MGGGGVGRGGGLSFAPGSSVMLKAPQVGRGFSMTDDPGAKAKAGLEKVHPRPSRSSSNPLRLNDEDGGEEGVGSTEPPQSFLNLRDTHVFVHASSKSYKSLIFSPLKLSKIPSILFSLGGCAKINYVPTSKSPTHTTR